MTVERIPAYPDGHVGHLSNDQQAALDRFKEVITGSGYFHPADGPKRASHDDETLLRYLRARKFSPDEAAKQFFSTEEWRKVNNLEKVYESISVDRYEQTRKLYPQWTGRRDKRGIPVYLFQIKELASSRISAYEKSLATGPKSRAELDAKEPPRLLYLFSLYENLLRFVMPLCTSIETRPNPETPISLSNNIVDVHGVGLKMFWNLKSHMQAASELATAHYPETLDRIFIVGAPSYFSTVWGWINRWFDPGTVSKIFILSSNEVLPTLKKYIDIENIPKQYGGELDFEFGDMPDVEDEINAKVEWTADAPVSAKTGKPTLPEGAVRWQRGQGEYDGYMEAVAVGEVDSVPRRTVIARIKGDFGATRGVASVSSSTEALTSAAPSGEKPTEPGSVVNGGTGAGLLDSTGSSLVNDRDDEKNGNDGALSTTNGLEGKLEAVQLSGCDGRSVEPVGNGLPLSNQAVV